MAKRPERAMESGEDTAFIDSGAMLPPILTFEMLSKFY